MSKADTWCHICKRRGDVVPLFALTCFRRYPGWTRFCEDCLRDLAEWLRVDEERQKLGLPSGRREG